MKTTRFLLAAFGILSAGLVRAADTPQASDRVQVVFDHPDKFTDIKDHSTPTEKGEAGILSDLKDFITYKANQLLPAGDRFSITFTDIDLAGDFEPWHGPNWDDVRIVKDVYPPAFKFSWTVTDASGAVLKSGTENIRDLNYQMRATLNTSDPLRYEKDILSDWMIGHIHKISSP